MKGKPNTDQFKLTKDPSAFLEGGAADKVEKIEKPTKISHVSDAPTYPQTLDTKMRREQKIFRLSIDLINVLKRESYERTVKSGSRVTETDLVEQALRMFFEIDI